MITYGFFNSVDGDRQYNADTFNCFFEGLISSNGIFENVDGGFRVNANGTGLIVNIDTGKAIVNNHWVRNDAITTATFDAAHTLFGRYDMLCLRWNGSNRTISLAVTTGTAASAPEKPVPQQNTDTLYEIVLAYVYIPANATTLTDANITDCRYDTKLCGVITGLIDQVDTSSLYRQYVAKFEELTNQMISWQNAQKQLYDTWFSALTEDLVVNTKLTRKVYNYITTREAGTQYINIPTEVNYANGDILDVYVNGVLLAVGADYEIMQNEVENVPMIFVYSDIEKDNTVTFQNTKCDVGTVLADLNEIIALQESYIDGGN